MGCVCISACSESIMVRGIPKEPEQPGELTELQEVQISAPCAPAWRERGCAKPSLAQRRGMVWLVCSICPGHTEGARASSQGGRAQCLGWLHTELHLTCSSWTAVLYSPICVCVHLEKLASEESWNFSINLFLFGFVLLLMSHRQGLLSVAYVRQCAN